MSHLPECSDPQSAAAEFAKPTLRQCGCTFYPDKAECLHTQIYEDRMRSFLALSESSMQGAYGMNCECNGPIHGVMGVERCQTCGKLAGSSIMVPFGTPLPPRTRKRVKTEAYHCDHCDVSMPLSERVGHLLTVPHRLRVYKALGHPNPERAAKAVLA